MILELYGLTGSGKTFLAEKLKRRGLEITKFNSKLQKYSNSLLFMIKNPLTSFNLFLELNTNSCIKLDKLNFSRKVKLRVIRNILLLSTMAHYNKAESKENSLVDEGFFQIIHTIYERKKNLKSIKRLIDKIKKPDALILLNIKKSLRAKRLKERNLPRKDLFGPVYFDDWHNAMEHNDKIIRDLLKKQNRFKVIEIKNDRDIKNLELFF